MSAQRFGTLHAVHSFASPSGGQTRQDLLAQVGAQWAQQDAAAATSWARGLSEQEREPVLAAITTRPTLPEPPPGAAL